MSSILSNFGQNMTNMRQKRCRLAVIFASFDITSFFKVQQKISLNFPHQDPHKSKGPFVSCPSILPLYLSENYRQSYDQPTAHELAPNPNSDVTFDLRPLNELFNCPFHCPLFPLATIATRRRRHGKSAERLQEDEFVPKKAFRLTQITIKSAKSKKNHGNRFICVADSKPHGPEGPYSQ